MSSKRNKSFAIVFIILFLGYYQKWLYAILYETVGGSVDLDPALPMIINGVQRLRNQHGSQDDANELEERSELSEKDSNNNGALPVFSSMAFLKIDLKLQLQADELAERIQREIDSSQSTYSSKYDCKGPKLHCGSSVDCGLGCQIHSMMSCLMVAYVSNRTLIPDFRNWPYTIPWTDVLQPIGTSDYCPVDNETATVKWGKPGFSLSLPASNNNNIISMHVCFFHVCDNMITSNCICPA